MDSKVQSYKVDAKENLKKLIGDAPGGVLFTDYRSLTVKQITELRGKLRKEKVSYRVVKNNYAKIAFNELSLQFEADALMGPTALALAEDEIGQAAKILVDEEKETTLKIKGGIIDGSYMDAKQVVAFSKLPTKGQLLAQLLGVMNAPAREMASVVSAVPRSLVQVLAAVRDKKEEGAA